MSGEEKMKEVVFLKFLQKAFFWLVKGHIVQTFVSWQSLEGDFKTCFVATYFKTFNA